MRNSVIISKRNVIIIVAALLVLSLSVAVTIAFLKNESNAATNTFEMAEHAVSVTEDFDGTVKKNVNVKNDGTSSVYVKVRLITYRVNDDGNRIGGKAEIPAFVPGTNWIDAGDDTYIYALPLASGKSPEKCLIPSTGITLKQYTDDDGGKQVVEVVAETIQASPADAVKTAWNVNVGVDGVISLKSK